MHIAEGALSAPVLIGGAVLAITGVAVGLKKTHFDQIPKVAVVSSAFFVASLIHVPLGITSAHLILNGLSGLILGWAVFPALVVALFLQAILFGFGGLTALGANTVVMALPGLACFYLFGRLVRSGQRKKVLLAGFGAGVVGVGLGCLLLGAALYLSNKNFLTVVQLALTAHLPVMVIEGFISAAVVGFISRVRPDALDPAGLS